MAQPANFNFLARSGSRASSRQEDHADFAKPAPQKPTPPAVVAPLLPPAPELRPIQIGPVPEVPMVPVGYQGAGDYSGRFDQMRKVPDTTALTGEFNNLKAQTLDSLSKDILFWSNFAKAIISVGQAVFAVGQGLPLKGAAEQLQSDALVLQGRVNGIVGNFYAAKANNDVNGMIAAYNDLQSAAQQANEIQRRGREIETKAATFTQQMSLFNYGTSAIGIGQSGLALGTEIYKASTGQEYDPYKIGQSSATALYQGATATDLLSGVPFASLIPTAIGTATEVARAFTSEQDVGELGVNFAGAIGGSKAQQLVKQGLIYEQQGKEELAGAMYASAGLETIKPIATLFGPVGLPVAQVGIPALQGLSVFSANLAAGEDLGTAALRGSNFGASQSFANNLLSVSNNVFGTQFWNDAPVSGAIREINTPVTTTEIVSTTPSFAAEKGGIRLRSVTDISLANELKANKLLVQDIYQDRDQLYFSPEQKFNAYQRQIVYLANKNDPSAYQKMDLLTRTAVRGGFLPAKYDGLMPSQIINSVPSGADFAIIAAE
ncbi:hypothetical protein EBZ80_07060 [bacterium]|nr:hypothetical protein [bacterium]